MSRITIAPETIREILDRIQQLFLEDDIPWIVGYSGGKDSSATLQLVWYAIAELDAGARNRKPVYVLSTDTLVEQPVVAAWVRKSLEGIRATALTQQLPFIAKQLIPDTKDTYWVNLIGRGYPAPRQGFRWCTSRLKIDPANRFIVQTTRSHGESIVVLGTRHDESATRSAVMTRHEQKRHRKWLNPNSTLPNSWVFSPIERWTTDDVWYYLMQYKNPWGCSNRDLLSMYRGATADNECPIQLDKSTPSCGSSRFGCWVCTLVSSDKSMEAMIQNDQEKEWMTPLLDLRNEIACIGDDGRIHDRDRRDFRRMDGRVVRKRTKGQDADTEEPDEPDVVPGPYIKEWREHLLHRLLSTQRLVRQTAPDDLAEIQLITSDELREIRRIWVEEKHEFCDSLPRIYAAVMGEEYPYKDDLRLGPFGPDEWQLLERLCAGNRIFLELQSSLLDIEQRSLIDAERANIVDELRNTIKRCYFVDERDAIEFILQQSSESTTDLGPVSP
jgi:DNA sulfur modification protein DndC